MLCFPPFYVTYTVLRRLSIPELVQYYTTGHVDYQDSKGL